MSKILHDNVIAAIRATTVFFQNSQVKSLPDRKSWALTKLKAFTDDKVNVA